ncbi:MAG TPA: methyl-accepting chemotaxis protein, partial [Candidatus Goldiibacteriota bacterium]|nr:methyl-accepting chemotaxis protein [Candidatus Goldiibacteriota bacterium]
KAAEGIRSGQRKPVSGAARAITADALGFIESLRSAEKSRTSEIAANAGDIRNSISGIVSLGDTLLNRIKSARKEVKDNNEHLRKVGVIIGNLAAALNRIINEIKNISERMSGIVSIAKAGSRMTGSEIKAMGSIKSAVSESADVINRLQETARETKKIVQSVADIAKKTNLLSLNAGIEAARAGEAGKSFAVVAQEVRDLAEAATRATGEMSDFLARTEDLARQAVSVISGQSKIEEAVQVVYSASDSFLNIMMSLTEISKMLSEIYSTAEEYRTDNDLLRILSGKMSDRLKNLTAEIDVVFDSMKASMAALEEVSAKAGMVEGVTKK